MGHTSMVKHSFLTAVLRERKFPKPKLRCLEVKISSRDSGILQVVSKGAWFWILQKLSSGC
jgi:hypothetical protein